MNTPVIYRIISPTNKYYIGQTYNFKKRILEHKNGYGWRQKSIVHDSIKKYGLEAHSISIICELPHDTDHSILNIYEDLYLSQYKEVGFTMMNIREAGSRGLHSEITRKRMSESQKGNKNNLGKKRPMSEDWKRKIGDGNRGKINHTEAYKLKLANKMKGNAYTKGKEIHKRRKSIFQYSKSGDFVRSWDGVNNAADTLGIGRTNLTNCLTGLSKTAGGYIWKYNHKN